MFRTMFETYQISQVCEQNTDLVLKENKISTSLYYTSFNRPFFCSAW